MRRYIISFCTLLVALLIASHYRAYVYSDEKLLTLAEQRLFEDYSRYTLCDELTFLQTSYLPNLQERFSVSWMCVNQDTESYLIDATVESDGFVSVKRLALTLDEAIKIVERNSTAD